MPRAKSTSREDIFDSTSDSRSQPEGGVGVRVGGRLKKAKIVFDPSVNNMPKKRATRSLSVTFPQNWQNAPRTTDKSSDSSRSPPVLEPQVSDCCMVCGKVDKKTKKLIACKDCNYKVHSTCVKLIFQNLNLLEEHWRCDNCRTCVVCYETSEVSQLITCCVCVDAYHVGCHSPRIITKFINKLKWECSKCQSINKSATTDNMPLYKKPRENNDKSSDTIIITTATTTTTNNTDKKFINVKLKCIENVNDIKTENIKAKGVIDFRKKAAVQQKEDFDEIPDIADWSSEKLTKYMTKYFPEEAHVFRDHEIDGQSLLLMKRSDVVEGLSLKLGPAIRMYSFIVKLQTKSNDPRLTWM